MKNRQWNREFPDVPEYVHHTVSDTLAGLGNGQEKAGMHIKVVQKGEKMKRIKTRTMIILAAALIIILGTTVAAAELFRWNERATEIFEAEPERIYEGGCHVKKRSRNCRTGWSRKR